MVDSQCDDELDAAIAAEYREAAGTVGRPFVPVYLRGSREENVRRITSSSRVSSGNGRLVDPSDLLLIRDSRDLLEFSGVEGLHLDFVDVDAEENAMRLYQYTRQLFVKELLAKGYARRLNAMYHLCRITDRV